MASPRDPYKYFRVEARELLDGMNQGILEIEKKGASPEHVGRILRLAHTLKGAARVVHLGAMADRVHAMEEELEPLRNSEVTPHPALMERLFHLLDGMMQSLSSLEVKPTAEPLAGALASLPSGETRLETVRLEIAELDGLMEGLREASGGLDVLRKAFLGLDRVRHLAQDFASQNSESLEPRFRFEAQELNSWLERFGRQAVVGLEQAERELVQVHERAGRMRLLPASVLFDFLERACRDAAAASGRQVLFEARGGDQRMDAPVLAALQEGLQHAVRNAVVHGIENPALRAASGKNSQGSVTVELQRRDGRLYIRCADDGAGIDTAKVRSAAVRRGWLLPTAPELSQDEALAFLLRGGLSTSETVTELSGRGLGLDVLRGVVTRFKGELRIRSQMGRGTEIEIEVPYSLSSFPVLELMADGRPSLIPFDSVRSALRLDEANLVHGPQGDTLLADGEVLPFLSLGDCFPDPGRTSAQPRAVVLIKNAGGTTALGVEKVLGVREAVVLPLPDLAPSDHLASGACLDASGNPSLVLDPEGLAREAQSRSRAQRSTDAAPKRSVLVVDDSLTTRMLEQSILETAGYDVEVAASAEEGLAKALKKRYGLFLVDVEMPGMDGFQLLERFRGDPGLRDIPAILVTSRAARDDRLRGESVGARDYVVKGEFDQARLLSRIRELLA